ncbi:MAG: prephenate dehydrogenase [Actinobacteria bacterium]|nr:prephenate dehydrogenase [Actinomycetota bacterium]
MKTDKVAIIGIGLIGGSLGLALKQISNPPKITGIARRQEVIDKAIETGAIDEGTTFFEEGVKDADIIFIATPVGSIVDIAKKIIPYLKQKAIITDVGSTKATIVKEIEEAAPSDIYFIGGHPMAGSEQTGVEAATPFLFKNSYYILTPTKKTNNEAFSHLHSLLTQIGAYVLAIDAEKHDSTVATISHLPHFAAASLVNVTQSRMNENENLIKLAAGGFKDMTRIAIGSPEIWLDIAFENRTAILEALNAYKKEIEKIYEFIKDKDKEGLMQRLNEAREKRSALQRVLHKEPLNLCKLNIAVEDKPGVISDVTVAIGQLGVNIENIEIFYTPQSRLGILEIIVMGEDAAQKAASVLLKKGYEVKIENM